ncbi:MAG TPA: hypothetical protein VE053_03310 [Allosphingosinicella sp.]|nr:hypothetical protein [Allosphingosinicella sp.]
MKIIISLIALVGCQAPLISNSSQADEKEALKTIRSLLIESIAEGDKSIVINIAAVDLNNDGVSEVIAYVKGEDACGSGGCNLFVLRTSSGGYEPVSRLTVSWPPIRVLDSKSNGWHDIAVWVQGGGILPGYEARLRFDGKGYPTNPSLVPREKGEPPKGRIVIDRSDKGHAAIYE